MYLFDQLFWMSPISCYHWIPHSLCDALLAGLGSNTPNYSIVLSLVGPSHPALGHHRSPLNPTVVIYLALASPNGFCIDLIKETRKEEYHFIFKHLLNTIYQAVYYFILVTLWPWEVDIIAFYTLALWRWKKLCHLPASIANKWQIWGWSYLSDYNQYSNWKLWYMLYISYLFKCVEKNGSFLRSIIIIEFLVYKSFGDMNSQMSQL